MAEGKIIEELLTKIDVLTLKIDKLEERINQLEGTFDVGGVIIDGLPEYAKTYASKFSGGDK